MKANDNQMSIDEILINYKTDLSLNNFSVENFEHNIYLSQRKLEQIKRGDNLTEEVWEYMLLEYLTSNPLIRIKTKIERNFMILSERFLYKIFRRKNLEVTKPIIFIKNYDILDKQFIYIPVMSQCGIWNLAMIENLRWNFNRNPADQGKKPLLYLFNFEKLQNNPKDILKKITDYVNSFMKMYFQLRATFETDPFWGEYKGITYSSFEAILVRVQSSTAIDDTGLITFKILSECLSEIQDDSTNFLEKTNFNEYANQTVASYYRDILGNKISDSLIKNRVAIESPKRNISFKNLSEKDKKKEVINLFIVKNSPSVNSVCSRQSRKRMNAALEGYFGTLISGKSKFLALENEESLFNSGFDLNKSASVKNSSRQEEMDEDIIYFPKSTSDDIVKAKSNIITSLKRPQPDFSEINEASFGGNNNYLDMNYHGDYSRYINISGVSDSVNGSMMSFHKSSKQKTAKFVMCKQEHDEYEINPPCKAETKIIPIVIEYRKSDGRNLEFIHSSNSRPPLPKLEISKTQNYIDASTIPNTKSVSMKETKKEPFYFSFDKDACVDNTSEKYSKKESSIEVSLDSQPVQKKHSEFIIANPILANKKKKNKKKIKKEINFYEEILNTETEMQTHEDTEINQTSFNNNNSYVRNFPFHNTKTNNTLIFFNTFQDNEGDKNSINFMNKSTTTFSGQSDNFPFLENPQSRDTKRKKETAKMKELIQSFGDNDKKKQIMQIEDKEQYSEGACTTCTKQCSIF